MVVTAFFVIEKKKKKICFTVGEEILKPKNYFCL